MSARTKHHNAGVIFSEIASLAFAVERFGVMLTEEAGADDGRDAEALRTGVRALSAQIALLADRGSEEVGGPVLAGAQCVERYLLPPVYDLAAAAGLGERAVRR